MEGTDGKTEGTVPIQKKEAGQGAGPSSAKPAPEQHQQQVDRETVRPTPPAGRVPQPPHIDVPVETRTPLEAASIHGAEPSCAKHLTQGHPQPEYQPSVPHADPPQPHIPSNLAAEGQGGGQAAEQHQPRHPADTQPELRNAGQDVSHSQGLGEPSSAAAMQQTLHDSVGAAAPRPAQLQQAVPAQPTAEELRLPTITAARASAEGKEIEVVRDTRGNAMYRFTHGDGAQSYFWGRNGMHWVTLSYTAVAYLTATAWVQVTSANIEYMVNLQLRAAPSENASLSRHAAATGEACAMLTAGRTLPDADPSIRLHEPASTTSSRMQQGTQQAVAGSRAGSSNLPEASNTEQQELRAEGTASAVTWIITLPDGSKRYQHREKLIVSAVPWEFTSVHRVAPTRRSDCTGLIWRFRQKQRAILQARMAAAAQTGVQPHGRTPQAADPTERPGHTAELHAAFNAVEGAPPPPGALLQLAQQQQRHSPPQPQPPARLATAATGSSSHTAVQVNPQYAPLPRTQHAPRVMSHPEGTRGHGFNSSCTTTNVLPSIDNSTGVQRHSPLDNLPTDAPFNPHRQPYLIAQPPPSFFCDSPSSQTHHTAPTVQRAWSSHPSGESPHSYARYPQQHRHSQSVPPFPPRAAHMGLAGPSRAPYFSPPAPQQGPHQGMLPGEHGWRRAAARIAGNVPDPDSLPEPINWTQLSTEHGAFPDAARPRYGAVRYVEHEWMGEARAVVPRLQLPPVPSANAFAANTREWAGPGAGTSWGAQETGLGYSRDPPLLLPNDLPPAASARGALAPISLPDEPLMQAAEGAGSGAGSQDPTPLSARDSTQPAPLSARSTETPKRRAADVPEGGESPAKRPTQAAGSSPWKAGKQEQGCKDQATAGGLQGEEPMPASSEPQLPALAAEGDWSTDLLQFDSDAQQSDPYLDDLNLDTSLTMDPDAFDSLINDFFS